MPKKTPTIALTQNRVRFHRETLGLTQAELADRTGLRQSHISMIETKLVNSRLSLDTARRLARFFGMPIEAVFLDEVTR